MAYDEALAGRIRALLEAASDVTEQRMFGGLAFLAGGSLGVAVSGKGGLMVRVEPAEADALLAEPGVGVVEMRGRPVDGWVRVQADAVRSPSDLEAWVRRGMGHARRLRET